MKKVIVNGKQRYIRSYGWPADSKGWVDITFWNWQMGLYNVKTGEVIDQINGHYIKFLHMNPREFIAVLELENNERCVLDYGRNIIFSGLKKSCNADWVSIIQQKPEAFAYLPSKYFYNGEHIRRSEGTHRGYIQLALDTVEQEKSRLSLEELTVRVDEIKDIIAKKLKEEEDNIARGEADRKAVKEILGRKDKLFEDAKKQLISADDEAE